MAQGAVDTLLGRLTALLIDEAQLLGGLRGDVQFIRDEMESMNSLLLHLSEAQHRAHHVHTWMRQVVGLARDCEAYVELYLRHVGGGGEEAADPSAGCGSSCLLSRLRRLLRLLRTLPARHQIATRVQELKDRARDVGDRRLRYGITVPDSAGAEDGDDDAQSLQTAAGKEEDLGRRAVLFDSSAEPPGDEDEVEKKAIDALIKWLVREPPPPAAAAAARDDGEPQQVRIFCIVGPWSQYTGKSADQIAEAVYQRHSVATLFSCKALVRLFADEVGTTTTLLANILEKMTGVHHGKEDEDEDEQLASKLQGYLKGKRFLIVITEVWGDRKWKPSLDALLHAADGCHPGSAIVMATNDDGLALSSYPYKIINSRSLLEFYGDKVNKLGAWYLVMNYIYGNLCDSSAFARKMFLHLLYVNPITTKDEALMYNNAISKWRQQNRSIAQKIVVFCYNELPSKYRSCLLYLTIFPQGLVIKTKRLTRRWAAEGLVSTTASRNEAESAEDEAEHYWDELFIRGFISPVEISAAGNIKSCTLHHEVFKVIFKIARDVNIVDTKLPADLARHLSIHNRVGLQKSHSDDYYSKGIVASLPSLAASPQWKLLKVLDLEGCQGLENHHLKIICKILLLKYFNLRNTDVAELPKQIKELQCLETLDIRQTKVRMLSKKAVVLPLLKHFLAGHNVSASNDHRTSEEPIATVSMPVRIQKMKNLEILSYVQITGSDSELAGIAQLLKLRKLGVALQGKSVKLSDLFCQIEKLHKCLRSLSIRMSWQAGSENHDARIAEALPRLPNFIERLNLCGVTSGLVCSIKDQHQLTKITLSQTYMKEDDLRILGKLGALQGLRLQHKSYTESEIAFKKYEFQSLKYLLVEGNDDITKIRFAIGTAPKLEWIIWSFATMDALSGIDWLPKLKKLELNGDCDLDPIKESLEGHPCNAILEHKLRQQRQAE